ncbi:MAG: PTS ascorbate transporter subunit IIC [Anaerolineaceae bacterium]|nr:PTS ascorbate transporter subunit IIC [Anaerolineaceae bacterium]
MNIVEFLTTFLSNAAILVGLISMVGLIALKKSFGVVLSGTLKTILGFIILGAGAGVVVNAVVPLGDLFNQVLNIPNAALPVNEVFVAIAQKSLGRQIGLVFLFAFILNLLIARFTKFKYIFLTGHHILFIATLSAGMLSVMPFFAGNEALLIIVASVVSAIWMVAFPALSAPFMKKIIGSEDFVMGHFGTTNYVLAGYLGQFVGKKEDSTENIKFPEWISFMKEPLVAMGFVMFLIYLVVGFIGQAKGVAVGDILGGYWLYKGFLQALGFAGGIGVILLGVRMVLAEVVPAFHGIAEKVVPNAKPALDCPAVFPYAPNAVLVGYLASIVGGLAAMAVQIAAGGAIGGVILPSMIIHFFVGGTAGVFGNSTGGWKGAVLGGFLTGVMFTLLAGTTYSALGAMNPEWQGASFGDTDFGVLGNVLAFLGSLLK